MATPTPDTDGDGINDDDEVAYGWDPNSNDFNHAAKTETLIYDDAHRLKAVSGRSVLSYTPDENGNLTSTSSP